MNLIFSEIQASVKYGYGVRHVQVFLFFLCLTMGYAARAHLGVTIVGMTSLDDLKDEIAVDIKDVNGSTNYRGRKDFNLNDSSIGQIIKSQDSSWNIYKVWNIHLHIKMYFIFK